MKYTIPEQLRRHRMARGMSLRALAVSAHTTASSICDIESGKREPGLDLMLRLCDALEIELDVK